MFSYWLVGVAAFMAMYPIKHDTKIEISDTYLGTNSILIIKFIMTSHT